jgi:hypothetical protein
VTLQAGYTAERDHTVAWRGRAIYRAFYFSGL